VSSPDGVTRRCVLEVARGLGLPVLEQACALAEALAGDEFFMTGTTTEVVPVSAIDGRRIGSGRPGPVTMKLQAALASLIDRECG